VPVQNLVELTPSVLTGQDTAARARAFAAEVLGKPACSGARPAGILRLSQAVMPAPTAG
jgi:3-hydroxybutyryl-CoA dehydrogenase